MSAARAIPLAETAFHWTIDPNGRLFWWNGEPYRAIRHHHRDFTLRLFRSKIVDRLVGRGLLVPTEITDWRISGYSLVLKHQRVPFISLFNEWNAAMLQDAALAQLELEIALEPLGLMLQDGHTDNTLFDGSRPVFVDFCSIVPNIATRVWEAEDEFRRNFLNPLRLLHEGQFELVRATMRPDRLGVPHHVADPAAGLPDPPPWPTQWASHAKKIARANLPEPVFVWLKRQQRAVQRARAKNDQTAPALREERLARLRDEIAALSFPAANLGDAASDAPTPIEPLHSLFTRLHPVSILVLNGNRSIARLAARQGVATAIFTPTEAASRRAYLEARAEGYPLLPVHIGPGYPAGDPAWLDPARDLDKRYRADLVLAADLRPPSNAAQQVQLLEQIQRYARRWVLLDNRWLSESLAACFQHATLEQGWLVCERRPGIDRLSANPYTTDEPGENGL